ncbi:MULTISPECIES: 2-phospho-L-lactate guanylyltransferase [Gordonia]|uniref:2-phospho-L-lactate guanylyltransferase n=1 Tax=Gordonia TaxID=2053 RepID=UPI001E454F93|nr:MULTISPECIES: 2-phospho-L-lactate guanylyltransferase [Gordonia]MCM3896747.1 2-phospho-L-lactate guanylyltransferase [Gordonia sputi]
MTLSCVRGHPNERRRMPADAPVPADRGQHCGDSGDECALGTVVAVLAVKRLGDAKSRLVSTMSDAAGVETPETSLIELSPAQRERLRADPGAFVLAMLADTIGTLHEAGIRDVVVVTPDDRVRERAQQLSAHVVDEPGDVAGDLNAAYALGAAEARTMWPLHRWVVIVQADLPAAQPSSLREIVDAAVERGESMVTDRAGTGTSLLLRPMTAHELPRFGPDSAAAHRSAGVVELDPEHLLWPDVRTDVDTVDDLAAALRLGVGEHTLSVLGNAEISDATASGVGDQSDAS